MSSAFDPLAADYDRSRPHYPPQLYDDLERLTAPLAGRRVVELGAGTGIATRELRRRGARVLAVDPGPAMLARLRGHDPSTPVVLGVAEALPVPDGSADLVVGAQCWHWVDVARACREAARVLRPGGWLAVWWNDLDAAGQRWHDSQQDRLEAASPGYRRDYRSRDYGAEISATGLFAPVVERRGRWSRELDWPTYASWLRSKSYVAALGDAMEGFLAAEQASLAEAFGGGPIVEPFATRLVIGRSLP